MVSSGHRGDGRLRSRTVTFLAHAITYVLPVTFVVLVAAAFGAASYVNHFAMAALLMCWFATLAHHDNGQLCVRCIESVPKDAALRADGCRVPLRFAHFVESTAGILAMVTVCLVPVVATIILPAPTVDRVYLAVHMWVFAVIYADWTHGRLRPWCPFCRRWDDGGDHEPSPDPVLQRTVT
ncbi:hypothetical protein [Mycolicibacterium llatzerense]|uniref:hypothetical protein n=1 Tax=Mycolicibacterium llatzerense TaxID=280871 RepID=UPI0013A6E543|nr:hypothetical protein [Mycolicibacterium llatzerense]